MLPNKAREAVTGEDFRYECRVMDHATGHEKVVIVTHPGHGGHPPGKGLVRLRALAIASSQMEVTHIEEVNPLEQRDPR